MGTAAISVKLQEASAASVSGGNHLSPTHICIELPGFSSTEAGGESGSRTRSRSAAKSGREGLRRRPPSPKGLRITESVAGIGYYFKSHQIETLL